MLFPNMFYKTHRSPLSKLRQHQAEQLPVHVPVDPPEWTGDDHADLVSRDKSKVKEAVRRYLDAKVRTDWSFTWPPSSDHDDATTAAAATVGEAPADGNEPHDDDGYRVDDDDEDAVEDAVEDADEGILEEIRDDDAQSTYSVVSEDPVHYKPRQDWDSDIPVEELIECQSSGNHHDTDLFDLQSAKVRRKAQKRRELRDELQWNEGLACFEARRNAWTQARTVRMRVKPESPQTTPSQRSRRFFFRRSVSSTSSHDTAVHSGASDASPPGEPAKGPLGKHQQNNEKASNSSSSSSDLPTSSFPVETIIPVAPPILPPNNPLRSTIIPGNYLQLYDKIIVNSMQPSCPINLSDMIRSCVSGWKRDGEWPPRPALPVDPTFSALQTARRNGRTSAIADPGLHGANSHHEGHGHGRRLSLTGLLSRDKETDSRKGVRQSISKVFGLGSPLTTPVEATIVRPDRTVPL